MSRSPFNPDFYRQHRAALLRYAIHLTGDPVLGEDCVQEAFMRFAQSPARPEPVAPLRYLRRIVHNLAMDLHRAQARVGRESGDSRDDRRAVETLADDYPDSGRHLDARRELALLGQALQELPVAQRQALLLYRLEGLKLREIAERLDISVSQAHRLVTEGLDHCRRRLRQGPGDGSGT